MPGYDQHVYEKRCVSLAAPGHNIASVKRGTLYDNNAKAFVDDVEILCTFCGMSLAEIREQKIKKPRVPRAPKAPVEAPTV